MASWYKSVPHVHDHAKECCGIFYDGVQSIEGVTLPQHRIPGSYHPDTASHLLTPSPALYSGTTADHQWDCVPRQVQRVGTTICASDGEVFSPISSFVEPLMSEQSSRISQSYLIGDTDSLCSHGTRVVSGSIPLESTPFDQTAAEACGSKACPPPT